MDFKTKINEIVYEHNVLVDEVRKNRDAINYLFPKLADQLEDEETKEDLQDKIETLYEKLKSSESAYKELLKLYRIVVNKDYAKQTQELQQENAILKRKNEKLKKQIDKYLEST